MDLAQALLCLVTFSGNEPASIGSDRIKPSCGAVETIKQDEKVNLDFHRIGVEGNGTISVMAAGMQHQSPIGPDDL